MLIPGGSGPLSNAATRTLSRSRRSPVSPAVLIVAAVVVIAIIIVIVALA